MKSSSSSFEKPGREGVDDLNERLAGTGDERRAILDDDVGLDFAPERIDLHEIVDAGGKIEANVSAARVDTVGEGKVNRFVAPADGYGEVSVIEGPALDDVEPSAEAEHRDRAVRQRGSGAVERPPLPRLERQGEEVGAGRHDQPPTAENTALTFLALSIATYRADRKASASATFAA